MSTIRLQDAIGEIRNCYIEEAHAEPSHTQQNQTGGSVRKLWLVAAIAAITALLVGCAAAVWLNLDDLRMQEVTYLADMRYERDGSKIPATEKTRQYISVVGPEGSKNQLAAREWMDFKQSYDPDGTLRKAAGDFRRPAQYEDYTDAYTQDMLDKIDEICNKYGLKLSGEVATYQGVGKQDALLAEVFDESSVVKKNMGLELEFQGGRFVQCGDFDAAYQATMTHGDASQEFSFSLIYDYHDKDYFGYGCEMIENGEAVQQWNETLSDGTKVLFVCDPDGNTYILHDRADAFISVTLKNVGWDWDNPADVMTRQDMKLIAQALNYSIKPKPVADMAGWKQRLEAAREEYDNTPEDPAVTAERVRLYEENMCKDSYRDLIVQIRDHEDYFCQHCGGFYKNFWETVEYTLRDINDDGQEELLLGCNGQVCDIWTIQEGKTQRTCGAAEGYLCQGNIYEIYQFTDGKPMHTYERLLPDKGIECVAQVAYGYGEWRLYDGQTDTEKIISEEEAQKIIASYVRIPLEMKPVSSFPMESGK